MMLPGLSSWQRLRHSRGFGVHSPFAYRFIREVLCERNAYYAYADIDALADTWPEGRRGLRLLLRVAAWCRPSRVAVCGTGPVADTARRVIALAAPKALITDTTSDGCDMVVLCPGVSPALADAAFGLCSRDGAVLFTPARNDLPVGSLLRRLQDTLSYGHLFLNSGATAVFVARHTLPAESFQVRF